MGYKSKKRCTGGRRRKSRSRRVSGGRTRRSRSRRSMKGGYSQYMSNVPTYTNYSTAGVYLSPSMSALANPPPINKLPELR